MLPFHCIVSRFYCHVCVAHKCGADDLQALRVYLMNFRYECVNLTLSTCVGIFGIHWSLTTEDLKVLYKISLLSWDKNSQIKTDQANIRKVSLDKRNQKVKEMSTQLATKSNTSTSKYAEHVGNCASRFFCSRIITVPYAFGLSV